MRQSKKDLLVVSLNLTLQLDQHGIAKTVFRLWRRNLHPALADAVFLNIIAFFAVQADADVVLKTLFVEVRAAWVAGKVVWEGWFSVSHHVCPNKREKS